MANSHKNIKASIGKFTIILSIANIIGSIGTFVFRIIILITLIGSVYEPYTLFVKFILIFIPLAGFQLHIPLTREINYNKDVNNRTYLSKFLYSYFLMNIIAFFVYFLFSLLFVDYLSIRMIFLAGILLVFRGMNEFNIGVLRGRMQFYKSSVLSGFEGIFRIIMLLIYYLLQIDITLNIAIIIHLTPFLLTFFLGVLYSRDIWFNLKPILSHKRITFAELRNTLNSGFHISIYTLYQYGKIYLITSISLNLLNSDEFKVFDLSLIIISIIALFTSSISTSINSHAKDVNYLDNRNLIKSKYGLGFIGLFFVTLISILILQIFPFDYFLIKFAIGSDIDLSFIKIIRIYLFVPFVIIVHSLKEGEIMANSDYILFTKSLWGSIFFSVIIILLVQNLTSLLLLILFLPLSFLFESVIFLVLINRK